MRTLSGRFQTLRRARGQRGASAVEFALISVVFFPMLFGLIDYGVWFNDSLNTRQGVREAARLGVVQNFTGCSQTNKLDALRCVTKREVSPMTGATSVKVIAPSGWTQGRPLLVCAAVRVDGITGFVPLPNDRLITSVTQMSIEKGTPAPTGVSATASSWSQDPDPSGSNWSWCRSA